VIAFPISDTCLHKPRQLPSHLLALAYTTAGGCCLFYTVLIASFVLHTFFVILLVMFYLASRFYLEFEGKNDIGGLGDPPKRGSGIGAMIDLV